VSGKQQHGGQEPLDLPVEQGRPVGSVESAVRAAITAGQLEARDGGAAESAAALARGMDLALGRRDPYAVAAVGKPLGEALARLQLDPVSRDGGKPTGSADPWDQLVDELSAELKGGGRDHGRADSSAS
jgi:hypothetical protein